MSARRWWSGIWAAPADAARKISVRARMVHDNLREYGIEIALVFR
jgi:hypothetical protein